MDIRRWLRHLTAPQWWVLRAFDRATLDAIEEAVARSESRHRGELRFVVEGGLPVLRLWRRTTPRERAIELFSQLRVWDTAENSGILIYVQMADRCVEVVADRGIAALVDHEEWEDICRAMEQDFRAGDYRRGALDAITIAGELLARHLPARSVNPDELPDRPFVV